MNRVITHRKTPMICAPITGVTKQDIFDQLQTLKTFELDMIEWRADFFEEVIDTSAVLDVITTIKQQTTIPLLFTIRAMHEGGEQISLGHEDKVALLGMVCEQSEIDVIDYESSNDVAFVKKVREKSAQFGKELILSYHQFTETPSNDALNDKARLAIDYGADVVKIAVMPQTIKDTYRLLEVTRELSQQWDVPFITMSMGELGALSRVLGWSYGSVMTFGVAAASSAPGQIPVDTLRETILNMQGLLSEWPD